MFLAGFAILVSLGCNGPLTPQAKELLQSGYDLYAAGDDKSTIQNMDKFLLDNPNSSRSDEAYYLRGLARTRTINLPEARDDLTAAISETNNPELRAKAMVALGDMAYDSNDMALAEKMYRQSLEDALDGDKKTAHAHFRLGCVLQRLGRWKEADVQLDRTVYLLSNSELGKLASERTHSLAWTIQAGAFEKKNSADQTANRLKGKGLQAVSKPILYDDRLIFVVHVGRFSTYDQALAELDNTKAQAPDALILPTR